MSKIVVDSAVLEQALNALYATERFCAHKNFPANTVADAITTIRSSIIEAEEVFDVDNIEYDVDSDSGFVK
jgi:hypothetical protein